MYSSFVRVVNIRSGKGKLNCNVSRKALKKMHPYKQGIITYIFFNNFYSDFSYIQYL